MFARREDPLPAGAAARLWRWTGRGDAGGGLPRRTFLPWLLRHPRRWRPGIFLLRALAAAEVRRREKERVLGTELPTTVVLSSTTACSVRCPSCLRLGEVGKPARTLEADTARRVLDECRELGIAQVVLVEGEPPLAPGLDLLPAENPDLRFTLFTEGRALGRSRVETFARLANLTLVVSVGSGSGALAKVLDPETEGALGSLADHGLLFGASATLSGASVELFSTLETLERIRRLGARFALLFTDLPDLLEPGRWASLCWPERFRRVFVECVRAWGHSRRFPTVFAPEEASDCTEGDGAAGPRIIHVDAGGFLGPCPLAPSSLFHADHSTLSEAIRSDAFRALRARARGPGRRGAGGARGTFARELRKVTVLEDPPGNARSD